MMDIYTFDLSISLSIWSFSIQGSNIRIYNVDKGWKVQKNILAKSLRWTITDTSLSPDQRYLVSFHLAYNVLAFVLFCFKSQTHAFPPPKCIYEGKGAPLFGRYCNRWIKIPYCTISFNYPEKSNLKVVHHIWFGGFRRIYHPLGSPTNFRG